MKQITLVFLASLLWMSCKSSTTTPTTVTFNKLTTGSSFVYDYYSTDSTNAIVANSRDTLTDLVLATNLNFGGKTNVVSIQESGRSDIDTIHIVYETNNDVSIYSGEFMVGSGSWLTFPIASKATKTYVTRDTTEEAGETVISVDSITVTFVANENISVKGTTLETVKLKVRIAKAVLALGSFVTVSALESFTNFAPSLGFLVKSVQPSVRIPLAGWNEGYTQSLINYTIK